jgi:LAO/AO transport system kinase
MILEFEKLTVHNGFFLHRRNEQSKYWMYETINERLKKHFFKDEAIKPLMKMLENEVLFNRRSPFSAAKELLEAYFKGSDQGK